VWLVPDEKRQETLERHISERLPEYAELFIVTTFDNLGSLIHGSKEAVCK